MKYYKPLYFSIKELAHPKIINAIGENNTFMRLDASCLIDLDLIRIAWGSEVLCNVGALDSRGLRPPDDSDGSFYSMHKSGKAFDLSPKNGNIKKFQKMVKKLIEKGKLSAFNTLEDFDYTKTWVHVAKMNHAKRLLIIKP